MYRARPSVLGSLCSWSCLNLMNWCGGGDAGEKEEDRPKAERFIRPFSINSNAKVKLANDARLYQDQTLSHTSKNKNKICTERVALDQLQSYLEGMKPEQVQRTLTDRNNSQTTKIIQNLYVTSLGGLKSKTLKTFKVNLLLNATIDLPLVEAPNVETIRVPITEKEPDSLALYMSDVADKIQENYLKNGQTVIYCMDGNRNSIALTTAYLLKYTDLNLSEALLHLQYTRRGFELSKGNLGGFKRPVENFAKKLKKFDLPVGDKSVSASGAGPASSIKKGGGGTSTSNKDKSQKA